MTDAEKIDLARQAGMLVIDQRDNTAVIVAPPNPGNLSDEEWIELLSVASELVQIIERMNYTVRG